MDRDKVSGGRWSTVGGQAERPLGFDRLSPRSGQARLPRRKSLSYTLVCLWDSLSRLSEPPLLRGQGLSCTLVCLWDSPSRLSCAPGRARLESLAYIRTDTLLRHRSPGGGDCHKSGGVPSGWGACGENITHPRQSDRLCGAPAGSPPPVSRYACGTAFPGCPSHPSRGTKG